MKYLILSLLFLTACSHSETKTESTSSFITVSYMTCMPINKLYYKDQIKGIAPFWLDSEECGITYRNIRIHKDLIIAFGERASIILNKIDQNDDNPRAPLKVEDVNKMHCVIQLQSGKMKDISITCEELEKKLGVL